MNPPQQVDVHPSSRVVVSALAFVVRRKLAIGIGVALLIVLIAQYSSICAGGTCSQETVLRGNKDNISNPKKQRRLVEEKPTNSLPETENRVPTNQIPGGSPFTRGHFKTGQIIFPANQEEEDYTSDANKADNESSSSEKRKYTEEKNNDFKFNGTCLEPMEEPVFPWLKRAPLVILIGMQKGGTKALHAYLSEHELAVSGDSGETHFFDDGLKNKNGSDATEERVGIERNMSGIHQRVNQKLYAEKFLKGTYELRKDPRKFALDDSPRYLMYSDRVPEAIFCVAPWAKLIALLRNPIDRVVSAYNMLSRKQTFKLTWDHFLGTDLELLVKAGVLRNWTDPDDFDRFAGSEEEMMAWSRYLRSFQKQRQELPIGRSLYAIMLGHYFAAMDRAGKPGSNLLVIQSERMRDKIQEVYDEVLDFLDLPPHRLKVAEQLHPTQAADPLPDHWRATLEKLFEPYNQRLYKLLNWEQVWDKTMSTT